MEAVSLVEIATRYIEELIITGKLNPGEQIKEDDIAGNLGISRPPVREALKCLEGEGLLVRKPRKGAFVSQMTESDFREVYGLKAELYAIATDHAVDCITKEEINQLLSFVKRMKKNSGTEAGSILKYQELHHAFHTKIIEIAGNQRLLKFASTLHKQVMRYSFMTLSYGEHLNASHRYHQQILECIAIKDKKNARELMKEHVLDAMHFLLNTPGILESLQPISMVGARRA
ncbi:GntR family transcriptional regulator [Desulfospira joergensenii]|uniref:GntR family transcriptional regulator n=1 Tax=Desulfospira joergensenii TaxID=53329 RepID=UPI0003B48FB4|nr:GntR family transcriptional regulator [Desulfospira joergensenii]